jgi:phosphohistidine phosphatase
MKTLTLLRHAKSSWDDSVQRDLDRPLNAKGRRAAAAMGRHLRGLGMTFDHVAASPAVRVRETLDGFASGYGALPPIAEDRQLYLASAPMLLEAVHALPETAAHTLLVGHNPGLEDLVLLLTPGGAEPERKAVEEKYPTASVAELRFDVADWRAVAAGGATLARFIRPRDLDPTLGPDQD